MNDVSMAVESTMKKVLLCSAVMVVQSFATDSTIVAPQPTPTVKNDAKQPGSKDLTKRAIQFIHIQDSTIESKIENPYPNFVYLSMIKTLNGKQNGGEFLDLSVAQKSPVFWSIVKAGVWADINLDLASPKDENDKVVSTDYSFATGNFFVDDIALIGGGVRVFDGIPCGYAQMGILASKGAMLTSHLTAGFTWVMRDGDTASNYVSARNWVVSWSAYAPQLGYFSALRLKGDLFIPTASIKNVIHRVAVEVPISGILRWN